MKSMTSLVAAAALSLLTLPAFAGDATIKVLDPFARASSPSAKAGAAFMTVMNHGDSDDRLIAVRSDVAHRTELHTHKETDGGMKMLKAEEGFVIPAGGRHALARGGDHVMMLGLTESLTDGKTVSITLIFEKAGEITVDVPVDLERKGGHGDHSTHGDHSGHGDG